MSTNDEILSPNITESDLPSKEQVVKLCRKNGINANHLTHTHNDRKFFIKYNNVKMAEARNQHPSRGFDVSIRIPEIYHAFTSRYRTYIVMEHIDIDHLASNAQRAKAITELVSIESPENSTPGPIGGRYIRHRFFKDFTSTIAYKSVRELERHVNRVPQLIHRPETVDFTNGPMTCYYSDSYKHNFPVSADGQVWVVDFDQAGV